MYTEDKGTIYQIFV